MKVETRCSTTEKLPDGGKLLGFSAISDHSGVWFQIRLPPERADNYKLGDAVTFDVSLSLS